MTSTYENMTSMSCHTPTSAANLAPQTRLKSQRPHCLWSRVFLGVEGRAADKRVGCGRCAAHPHCGCKTSSEGSVSVHQKSLGASSKKATASETKLRPNDNTLHMFFVALRFAPSRKSSPVTPRSTRLQSPPYGDRSKPKDEVAIEYHLHCEANAE